MSLRSRRSRPQSKQIAGLALVLAIGGLLVFRRSRPHFYQIAGLAGVAIGGLLVSKMWILRLCGLCFQLILHCIAFGCGCTYTCLLNGGIFPLSFWVWASLLHVNRHHTYFFHGEISR